MNMAQTRNVHTKISRKVVLKVLILSVLCFQSAFCQTGGGDCSAGATQAAKNDICGGPYRGFCVDSVTYTAACQCFDSYTGSFCADIDTSTTSSNTNTLLALLLGLGGFYFLSNYNKQELSNVDLYGVTGSVVSDQELFSRGGGGGAVSGGIAPVPYISPYISPGYSINLPLPEELGITGPLMYDKKKMG